MIRKREGAFPPRLLATCLQEDAKDENPNWIRHLAIKGSKKLVFSSFLEKERSTYTFVFKDKKVVNIGYRYFPGKESGFTLNVLKTLGEFRSTRKINKISKYGEKETGTPRYSDYKGKDILVSSEFFPFEEENGIITTQQGTENVFPLFVIPYGPTTSYYMHLMMDMYGIEGGNFVNKTLKRGFTTQKSKFHTETRQGIDLFDLSLSFREKG
jgi:hypothetical protein